MKRQEGPDATVRALAAARRAACGLTAWPGAFPKELDEAYRLQGAVQAEWGRPVGGVKVGRVLGAWAERLGVDRFTGPVCRQTIQRASPGEPTPFPVIAGGTALLECEVIAVLGRDVPDHAHLAPEAARDLVAGLHIGIEIAGSPMARIDALGPLASVACFGNNNGAILGPAIAFGEQADRSEIHCLARIDGREAGRGDTTRLPGGIWTAVAFACAQQARIGRPLKAGDIICTGALTGMHPMAVGQRAQVTFGSDRGPLEQLECIAVPQEPAQGV